MTTLFWYQCMERRRGRSKSLRSSYTNASASDLDEDTLSELGAYEDREVEDLLGKAIKDADYDLDKEYYATEEELDEDEGSDFAQTESEGYCTESGQGKGRCH